MTVDPDRPADAEPWWRGADAAAWRALAAGGAGWMLDAMDVMLYAFALPNIQAEFGLTSAEAGGLMTATLVPSAVGGVVFGVLADRYGRVRMLMVSILMYSVFTALTATARSVPELVLWRVLVGFGLGGKWSAGSVLVAEAWPAKHRGKAIGLMQSGWAIGYILAALLSAAILPRAGWRALFAAGIAPALLLVWIRRNLRESPAVAGRAPQPLAETLRVLTRPPSLRYAVLATTTATLLLFAYWGLFTWMPAFLARPVAEGGAGLGIVKSTAWLIPMQVGAFFGYTSFGLLADRFGRRPTFIAFVLAAAVVVPIYGLNARSESVLLVMGPLVGFFGHGYFSVFGAMLAELFPGRIRATAQGLCYNLGRGASAVAPAAIGAVAGKDNLGGALALTSLLYVAGAAVMLSLPETRGKDLA
jgi:MFS family permease